MKQSLHGYAIYGPDVDCYFYERASINLFCELCGSYIGDEKYYPSNINARKSIESIAFSYDGMILMGDKLKNFLECGEIGYLTFKKVNSDPNLFVPVVGLVVEFDSERRGTRFINKCNVCGNFESVVGATPVFLKDANVIKPHGFYRTDIEFGSGREKSPIYIVGKELGAELSKHFAEVDLIEIRQG